MPVTKPLLISVETRLHKAVCQKFKQGGSLLHQNTFLNNSNYLTLPICICSIQQRHEKQIHLTCEGNPLFTMLHLAMDCLQNMHTHWHPSDVKLKKFLRHMSHFDPVVLFLHGHTPLTSSHCRSEEPLALHLHSTQPCPD